MNYELTMLKNAVRMKKSAALIAREIRLIATKSYDVSYWRNGTMGQVQAISELSAQAELLNDFYTAVRRALFALPAPYRALLVSVYIKDVDRQALAQRYDVSLSSVYRKLCDARRLFSNALVDMGCDEQWFKERYSDFEWVVRREQTPRRRVK